MVSENGGNTSQERGAEQAVEEIQNKIWKNYKRAFFNVCWH